MRIALLTVLLLLATAPTRAVELQYWSSSNPEEIKLARVLVDEWNAKHPDIVVKMQPLPAAMSSEEVLLSAIVSGTTPDVCSNILPAIIGRLTKSKAVVALDGFPGAEKFVARRSGAKVVDMFRSQDGRLYQVPWKSNPVMVAYNTALFAELGLTPPRTYAEFWKVASTLTRDADGDGRIDHWAMAFRRAKWWQRFFDFYPFYIAATGGKTLLDGDKAVFDGPEGVAVMSFFREGFKRGFFTQDPFFELLFLDGKTGMHLVGPWIIKRFRKLRPEFEFGFAPIPVPEAGSGPVYTYGDPKNIVIFATTKHPEQAWEFVKFLISKEADLKLLEITGQIPIRRNLTSDPMYAGFFKKRPLLTEMARQAEFTAPMDDSPHLVQIMDILSSHFEASAIYGVISPEKSVRDAARRVREIYDYW